MSVFFRFFRLRFRFFPVSCQHKKRSTGRHHSRDPFCEPPPPDKRGVHLCKDPLPKTSFSWFPDMSRERGWRGWLSSSVTTWQSESGALILSENSMVLESFSSAQGPPKRATNQRGRRCQMARLESLESEAPTYSLCTLSSLQLSSEGVRAPRRNPLQIED